MSEFKRIAPEQAQQLRQAGAQVVDIRDPQSYAHVYSVDGGFELWRSVYPADTSSGQAD